jgi:hypothetical protein
VKGSDANDRTEADALAVRRDAVQRQSSRRREVSLVLIGRPWLQFPGTHHSKSDALTITAASEVTLLTGPMLIADAAIIFPSIIYIYLSK